MFVMPTPPTYVPPCFCLLFAKLTPTTIMTQYDLYHRKRSLTGVCHHHRPSSLTTIHDIKMMSRASWKRPFWGYSIITPSLGPDVQRVGKIREWGKSVALFLFITKQFSNIYMLNNWPVFTLNSISLCSLYKRLF